MNAGLLLITHNELGKDMLATAAAILGKTGLASESIAVNNNCDPDAVQQAARNICDRLDSGDGVLVLTDLYGSTPSNIANRLADQHNVIVVSGVNIPMLLRIMNYPDMSLEQLAEKAASGAHDGIVLTKHKQASQGLPWKKEK